MSELRRTPNIGTASLEDHDRVRFTDLRKARLERLLEAMEQRGLDVCLFGREANARYATGVRRLWTAQTRGFVPTCIVVRSTGGARLLSFSASYEGIPEEFGSDDFFAVTWNPMRFIEHVMATPGVARARRVGVDGMTPLFDGLLKAAMPNATFVGAEPMMREIRRRKLPEEVDAIRIAAALAESAMASATRSVRPGLSERALLGIYLQRMCELGTSQFSRLGPFTVITPGQPVRAITGDRVLDDGCAVAMAGGALWNGYEGTLGRTWWCGDAGPSDEVRSLFRTWRRTIQAMVDECRPGNTGADLRAAHEKVAGAVSGMTIAYSLGLGHEGAVAGSSGGIDLDRRQEIHAGMVLVVRTTITGDAGAYFGEEMVYVGDDGPELLTTFSHGPLSC